MYEYYHQLLNQILLRIWQTIHLLIYLFFPIIDKIKTCDIDSRLKEKNPQWILKKVNFIVEFRVIQLR